MNNGIWFFLLISQLWLMVSVFSESQTARQTAVIWFGFAAAFMLIDIFTQWKKLQQAKREVDEAIKKIQKIEKEILEQELKTSKRKTKKK